MDEKNLDEALENGDAMAAMQYVQGIQPEKGENKKLPESIEKRINNSEAKVYLDRYKKKVEGLKNTKENLIGEIKKYVEEQKQQMKGDVFYDQIQEVIENKTKEKENVEKEEETYENLMKDKANKLKQEILNDIKGELLEVQNSGKEISNKIKSIEIKKHEEMKKFHDVKEIEELDKQLAEFNTKFNELKQKAQELNKELNEAEKITNIEGIKIELQPSREDVIPETVTPRTTTPETPEPEASTGKTVTPKEEKGYTAEEQYKNLIEGQDAMFSRETPSASVKTPETPKASTLGVATPEASTPEVATPGAPSSTIASKIQYFNVKRDRKGVTINGKFMSYEQIEKENQRLDVAKEIPAAILDFEARDGEDFELDKKITYAATAFKAENPEFDLDGFLEEYEKLIKDDREEKTGKKTTKMDLTYDLKNKFIILKPSERKKFKELRETAYEARKYAKLEMRGITKLRLNNRAHREDAKKKLEFLPMPKEGEEYKEKKTDNKAEENRNNKKKISKRESFLKSLRPKKGEKSEKDLKTEEEAKAKAEAIKAAVEKKIQKESEGER